MTNKLLSAVLKAIDDKKGQEVTVLHLAEICSFTDYFVICTGNTTRQTQAISNAIDEAALELGYSASHTEGYSGGDWILIDFMDFVIHIFTPAMRSFYDLERLWRDAPRLEPEPLRSVKRTRKPRTE
jgi:ribosome-associated protein